jgi:hypothetical protein
LSQCNLLCCTVTFLVYTEGSIAIKQPSRQALTPRPLLQPHTRIPGEGSEGRAKRSLLLRLRSCRRDAGALSAWSSDGLRLALSSELGFIEIWDIEADPPRPLVRLYHVPGGSGLAATPDGYISGPPEALELVRFGDGWALYDVTDVPERVSEERVLAALKPLAL